MQRLRILLISTAPLGAEMRGVGIRAHELARSLTSVGDVTLAGVGDDAEPADGITMLAYRHEDPVALRAPIEAADVVVAQPPTPAIMRWIVRSGARFIADLYDPEVLENLELFVQAPDRLQRVWLDLTTDRLARAIRHAHHVICASERQRDLWLGAMLMERAVDFDRYREDPALDGVIAVVPFGVPTQPPVHEASAGLRARFPEIRPEERVILWNGGLWNWLDPQTAVRAIARVAERRSDVRLVTMGASDHRAAREAEAATRELAHSLGLLGTTVLMNDRWVAYGDRASWLLEADCAVSCHGAHLETRFAFRTRLLDCFWASLPVVCTDGDELAAEVARHELGAVVPIGDHEAVAAAFETVLARGRAAYAEPLSMAAERYNWDRVTDPLRAMASRGPADARQRRGDARTGELARSLSHDAYRRAAATWRRLRRQ
jgi:glycosyltransferase involved in cell wall biosynthesis